MFRGCYTTNSTKKNQLKTGNEKYIIDKINYFTMMAFELFKLVADFI